MHNKHASFELFTFLVAYLDLLNPSKMCLKINPMLNLQIVCLNSVQNLIEGPGNWGIFVSLITIV